MHTPGSLPVVGDTVADFALPDATGTPRSLAELAGERPRLLVFYRGHWCAFCLAELAHYRDRIEDFAALDVDVAALSVDPPHRSAPLAAKLRLPFPVLADPARSVIAAWGLLNRLEMSIARPAAFLVDTDLRIAVAAVGGTMFRARPDEVLRVVTEWRSGNHAVAKRSWVAAGPRSWLLGTVNLLRRGFYTPYPPAPGKPST